MSQPHRPSGSSVRVLGLSNGDDRRAMSGVPGYLFDGLETSVAQVERIDYSVRGAHRVILAAGTFRPRRDAWRGHFQAGRMAHRAQSASLRAKTCELAGFDVALQVHGWSFGQPRPFTVFVDQTRLMADRGWPSWIPLPNRDRRWLLRAERKMYEGSAHIFAMGDSSRNSLSSDYGIDPSRITVVGGGLNFSERPDPRPFPPTQSILFVGRDFERKGGYVLLRAFERVRQVVPDATLHIAGPRQRIVGAGIIAHGPVDRATLATLFAATRVFCMPSLYEPYGLTFAEAMAYGVPCVGSTAQSIPEILDFGRAGLAPAAGNVEELTDELVALLTDDQRAIAIGEAGRRYGARVHTWEAVAKRMQPGLVAAAGRGLSVGVNAQSA